MRRIIGSRILRQLAIIQLVLATVHLTAGCSNQPVLHTIGIYEGPVHFGGHPVDDPSPSTIKISLHGSHPIILALFNYEAVMWDISADEGVVLKEIILSSAQGAKIKGIDEKVVRVTRKNFGTVYDENTMKQCAPILKNYTGLDISTFQTSYRSSEFSVGP